MKKTRTFLCSVWLMMTASVAQAGIIIAGTKKSSGSIITANRALTAWALFVIGFSIVALLISKRHRS